MPPEYRKYIKDAVKDHIELDKRAKELPSTSRKDQVISEFWWIILSGSWFAFGFAASAKFYHGFGIIGLIFVAMLGFVFGYKRV